MDVSVRPATVADAAAVARLTQQLGYEITPEVAETRLSHILSTPTQTFLIAEAAGEAVGCLHLSISDHIDEERSVRVEGVVVDRARRGSGVGKRLIAEGEAWARANGCGIVRLNSSSTRHGAHRFYERLGYTNVKTQYSFAKRVDGQGPETLIKLVPRVDP